MVGTVPVWENRVLLCRRAIEPRYNTWTLPAGFMELGESTAQGAARETLEESGARIELGEIYTIIDVPQIEQVHVFYLAQALGPELDPGPEPGSALRRGRDPLGRSGLPHGVQHPAPLLRRPQAWRLRPASLHP